MQRLNFYTSSSSRRCNRVPRCRSSVSRWATLRRISPGHWMGFLFHKTTGRTSSLPRRSLRRTMGSGCNTESPICSIAVFLSLSLTLSPNGTIMAPKIDEWCTRRLFAVINLRVLHARSSWELGLEAGFPSDGSRGSASIEPRGLRFSEPIERKITNHAVQSGRF